MNLVTVYSHLARKSFRYAFYPYRAEVRGHLSVEDELKGAG